MDNIITVKDLCLWYGSHKALTEGRSEESTIPQSVWKKHAGITPRRSEREAVRCGRAVRNRRKEK